MPVIKPIIPNELEEYNNIDISELFYNANTDEEDISTKSFLNISAQINCTNIEINKCKFKDARLINSICEQMYFSDILFENCDFSNSKFVDCSFSRVSFINCKMVGVNFSNSNFYNAYIKECIGRYSNFSTCSLKEVDFISSNFDSSSFEDIKFKTLQFKECSLISSNFFNSKLKGLDFTSSMIDGMLVKAEDLPGMIVTNMQAIGLSKLLGLIIK